MRTANSAVVKKTELNEENPDPRGKKPTGVSIPYTKHDRDTKCPDVEVAGRNNEVLQQPPPQRGSTQVVGREIKTTGNNSKMYSDKTLRGRGRSKIQLVRRKRIIQPAPVECNNRKQSEERICREAATALVRRHQAGLGSLCFGVY